MCKSILITCSDHLVDSLKKNPYAATVLLAIACHGSMQGKSITLDCHRQHLSKWTSISISALMKVVDYLVRENLISFRSDWQGWHMSVKPENGQTILSLIEDKSVCQTHALPLTQCAKNAELVCQTHTLPSTQCAKNTELVCQKHTLTPSVAHNSAENQSLTPSAQKQTTDYIYNNINNNLFKNNIYTHEETTKPSAPKTAAKTTVAQAREKLPERQERFRQQVMAHADKYDRKMLTDFYMYWSEPTRRGDHMRMDMQHTWDLGRRLYTWQQQTERFASRRTAASPYDTGRINYNNKEYTTEWH
jgi:hypothetical protein